MLNQLICPTNHAWFSLLFFFHNKQKYLLECHRKPNEKSNLVYFSWKILNLKPVDKYIGLIVKDRAVYKRRWERPDHFSNLIGSYAKIEIRLCYYKFWKNNWYEYIICKLATTFNSCDNDILVSFTFLTK